MVNPFRPPVGRSGDGFVIRIDDEEAALLRRLLGELRELLTADDPGSMAITSRLFPVAHPDDPEREQEYQRLMREELVASRLAAIAMVEESLDHRRRLSEDELGSFMQSVNAVRLVLGTMLDVGGARTGEGDDRDDDPGDDDVPPETAATPEYQLYAYLSWLLEHTVRALSGR